MSFTKYPKNWHSNGYGWHNSAALTYDGAGGKVNDMQSDTSSGVSSLYPSGKKLAEPINISDSNLGFNLSYGFAPGVLPCQVPNYCRDSDKKDNNEVDGGGHIGWALTAHTESVDSVSEDPIKAGVDAPIQAIFVPANEMPIYGNYYGLLRGAGQQILNEAMNKAGEYIGNAIQEILVVKKAAEVPRVLPSLNHMKVLGEKGTGLRGRSGDIQDFNTIRNECSANGTLFEDPEFPAVDSSLQFSRRPDRHIEWLRPMEIADDPQFFVEGYSRFDVQQGELGDCWLLAATATLTQDPKLFFRVVPDDQSFTEQYAGVFHFRFWQYGRWIDVVIDDRLPTYRGELLYMHSTEKNEFWSALLEKAYAKLHGSYEALKGGTTCEAMEDFTGGVTEMYELKEAPPTLFSILLKAYDRNSMMACSIEPDPDVLEAETPLGLIRGHAYSMTKVQLMDIVTPNTSGKIPMVRLRNPWGNEAEWNGPWSDQSSEWRFIPEHVKMDIGLTFDHDGEFWMSFADWMKYFDRVELCNLSPDSLSEGQVSGGKKKWEMSVFEGEWTAGMTAGGCRNYLDTFWHNPQYVVSLEDPDDDDDEGKCTVIIGLMQKNRRSKRDQGMDCLTIGFAVYSVSERDLAQKPLKMNFFKYNASVARSPAFINLREVSCRFKLPPGNYLIVPSTFEPNEEGEFLIRVFSENRNHMEYAFFDTDNSAAGGGVSYNSNPPYNPAYQQQQDPNYNPNPYPYAQQYSAQYDSAPPHSTPYPPQSSPYPSQATPYPPQPTPYPPQASYYPPQNAYPAPYPPSNLPYPPNPGYPPQQNTPYPPQNPYNQAPYPPQNPYYNNQENDENVGVGDIDDRILPELPEPSRPDPKKMAMEKLFKDIAGDDMEVDWMELKRILDHSMRDDFGPPRSTNGYQMASEAHTVEGGAYGNIDDGGGGTGGGGILAALCAALCKDSPLAETLGLNQPATQEAGGGGGGGGGGSGGQPFNGGGQNHQMAPITSQIVQPDYENGFSKDVCRSMIAMMDVDSSGKLGFEEFQTLLNDIAKWKAVFKLYDRDNSGRLSGFELREALNSAGYKLNNKILNALSHRYSSRDGMISFDDFIMCSVKIKTMMEIFQERDIDGTNMATFSMEEWMEKTIYS